MSAARLPHPDSTAARLRAGDAAALARLADATYPRALAVARSLAADEAGAERAVLDAYVALWVAREEAPGDEQLEAWVLAAVADALAARAPGPGARLRAWAGRVARSVRARTVRGRSVAPARGCAGLA
jgi:23S rRNA G2069 N7-methylase RlmK/C1962 C5-methylase RlmI